MVLDHNRWAVRELRDKFQFSAHSVDEMAQGGKQHVAAFFQARDSVLHDFQGRDQSLLGGGCGVAQTLERGNLSGTC